MIKKTFQQFRSAVLIIIAVSVVGVAAPQKAHAQWIVSDPGNLVENTINTISTVFTQVSSSFMEIKETALDPLAWALAKMLLQQMTADTVDWINNGFSGSPAFMSNPQGFFIDVADQATGAFIANSGPLSSLCSPFSLDIRASLGINTGQSRSIRTRYACTLSTIINNVQNASVSVSGDVNVNGDTVVGGGVSAGGRNSIEGFMGGDFTQGGWPAYIAMTTEPQNNYMGAYLTAESELREQIGHREATIQADILAGDGFMSFEKCDVLGTVSADAEADEADAIAGNDPNVTTKVNKDGSITYQICHTETPGSTISGALNKQLGTGSDSLVTADEIDEILGAVFQQLLKKVLEGGLGSAGKRNNSGGASSIVSSLRTDTGGSTGQHVTQNLANEIGKYLPDMEAYMAVEDEINVLVINLKNYANGVYSSCEANGYQANSDTVQGIITSRITPLVDKYGEEASQSYERLQDISEMQAMAESGELNPADLSDLSYEFADLLSSGRITTSLDVKKAKENLTEVTKTVNAIRSSLATYEMMCSVPAGGGTTTP